MTQIKLDKVKYTNLVDTYINYATTTADIVISGSIPDGVSQDFTVVVPYAREKTRADVYLQNLTTGQKQPTSIGARINPYQFASTETASHSVTYSGSNIIVTVTVANFTGSTVSLVAQTLRATVVQYLVPYSA